MQSSIVTYIQFALKSIEYEINLLLIDLYYRN